MIKEVKINEKRKKTRKRSIHNCHSFFLASFIPQNSFPTASPLPPMWLRHLLPADSVSSFSCDTLSGSPRGHRCDVAGLKKSKIFADFTLSNYYQHTVYVCTCAATELNRILLKNRSSGMPGGTFFGHRLLELWAQWVFSLVRITLNNETISVSENGRDICLYLEMSLATRPFCKNTEPLLLHAVWISDKLKIADLRRVNLLGNLEDHS